jgi:hypothetical protein
LQPKPRLSPKAGAFQPFGIARHSPVLHPRKSVLSAFIIGRIFCVTVFHSLIIALAESFCSSENLIRQTSSMMIELF